jgi:hypothetical protein
MATYGKYRMGLSDGRRITVEAFSAAVAIGSALRLYRGCKVVECHSGYTEAEAKHEGAMRGQKVLAGHVPYDIPKHEAMPEGVEGMSGPIYSPDAKAPILPSLFNDSKIVEASKKSKSQFDIL